MNIFDELDEVKCCKTKTITPKEEKQTLVWYDLADGMPEQGKKCLVLLHNGEVISSYVEFDYEFESDGVYGNEVAML